MGTQMLRSLKAQVYSKINMALLQISWSLDIVLLNMPITLYLDWDNFVNISIQLWEQFYLEWLTNGENIMIIYYEDIIREDNLIPTIKKVTEFMNFTVQKERLDCVSKHRKGKFYQSAKCIPKTQKEAGEKDDFVYLKKHVKWINSAIRKVNKAIKNRGFDDSHLRTYENNNVKLTYCSKI